MNNRPLPEILNRLSGRVVHAAYKVHETLGPGLLESVYEVCLMHELTKSGVHAERQVPLPVIYDELKLEAGFRIDLLVERQLESSRRVASCASGTGIDLPEAFRLQAGAVD